MSSRIYNNNFFILQQSLSCSSYPFSKHASCNSIYLPIKMVSNVAWHLKIYFALLWHHCLKKSLKRKTFVPWMENLLQKLEITHCISQSDMMNIRKTWLTYMYPTLDFRDLFSDKKLIKNKIIYIFPYTTSKGTEGKEKHSHPICSSCSFL